MVLFLYGAIITWCYSYLVPWNYRNVFTLVNKYWRIVLWVVVG